MEIEIISPIYRVLFCAELLDLISFYVAQNEDLISFSMVCKQWHNQLTDPVFWTCQIKKRTSIPDQLNFIANTLKHSNASYCLYNIRLFNETYENRDVFYSHPTHLFEHSELVEAVIKHAKACDLIQDLASFFITLKILSREDKNLAREAGERVDKLIMDTIVKYQHDPSLLREACGALWNMAFDDKTRERINEEGGTEMVMEIMKKYRENVRVLTKASGALANLVVAENSQKIVEEGGIEMSLEMMEKNPHHLELQQNISCVLVNLSVLPSDILKKDIAYRLVNGNGISLLLKSMQNHPCNFDVTFNACEILNTLITDQSWNQFSSEYREKIHESGGLTIIQKAKTLHPKCADLLLGF
jgi:hypothetical protein